MSTEKTLRNELEELRNNMWTRSDYPEGEIHTLLNSSTIGIDEEFDAVDYIEKEYGESLYSYILDASSPIEKVEEFLKRKLTNEEKINLIDWIDEIEECMFLASRATSIIEADNTMNALNESKKAILAKKFKFHIKKDIPILQYKEN